MRWYGKVLAGILLWLASYGQINSASGSKSDMFTVFGSMLVWYRCIGFLVSDENTTVRPSICIGEKSVELICDTIKGNESLVENCNFYFLMTFTKLQNASFWCKPHYNWIFGNSGYRVMKDLTMLKTICNKGIWTLFLPISQKHHSRHPTHSPWSCHICDPIQQKGHDVGFWKYWDSCII